MAQIIVSNGSIRIGEVADMFGVSMETLRKDLIFLDAGSIVLSLTKLIIFMSIIKIKSFFKNL